MMGTRRRRTRTSSRTPSSWRFDRDLKTIEHRLEWLERYVGEAADLEAEKARLKSQKRELIKEAP